MGMFKFFTIDNEIAKHANKIGKKIKECLDASKGKKLKKNKNIHIKNVNNKNTKKDKFLFFFFRKKIKFTKININK